jgi:hypothetical protein
VGQPEGAQLDTITFPGGATDTDLVGIDYRPRSNLLYGYAAGGTLYALRPNPAPGITVATQVNDPAADPTTGTFFGMDFNPVPDAIRVVSDADENLRVSPDNGGLLGTDTALTPASDVSAAAYTNSFQGAAASTLFGVDAASNSLVRQGGIDGTPSPNTGELTTIGPLGVDTTGNAGFDIETSFPSPDAPLNTAYVALTPAETPTASNYYTVSLTNGSLTQQGSGPIAGGAAIESIALPLTTTVRFASSVTQTAEAGTATVTLTRSGPGMNSAASINYTTNPGTAGTADFTATNGTLNFPNGVASRSFEVPITADTADEPDETFNITLSSPSSTLLLPNTNATGSVRINDNDDAPVTTPAPQPGVRCGKGTVQAGNECVAPKKKAKKKKKRKGKKRKK